MILSIRISIIGGILLLWNPILKGSGTKDLKTAENFLERGRVLYNKADYDSLPYYYHRASSIFRRYDKHVEAAACFLGMADYYRVSFKYKESAITLDSADSYIQQNLGENSESWADARITRGKLLILESQYGPSIKYLMEGLDLLNRLNSTPGNIAQTEYLIGSSYLYEGDFLNAEDYLFRAYDHYLGIGTDPSAELGWLLYNIAWLYDKLNNQQKWQEYTSKYIANLIAYAGPDHPELADYYNSLSSYFLGQGMSDSALIYLEKAEEIKVRASSGDNRDLVPLYIQRARIYEFRGNYYRALEYYQEALGILEQADDTKGYHGRSLYLNMGKLYRSLNDHVSAEEVWLHLLDLEGIVHPTYMADYYYHLADICRLLGEYQRSEMYFRKVFDIRDAHYPEDYHSRGFDHLGYAILLDSLKMYAKAGEFLLKAVHIIEKNYGFHHLRTAHFLKSTGDHFYLTGEPEKALEYYQQSIYAMSREYEVDDLAHNPPPAQINDDLFYLSLLKNKALVLKKLAGMTRDREDRQHMMIAIFSAYQTSINIIDQLRNSYLGDRGKLYLSENERDTYERAVESAFECYQLSSDPVYLDQAFMMAEKAKYATLLSVFHREESIKLAGIPDSVVQIDANLRRELSVLQELLLERQRDTLYDTSAIEQQQAAIFAVRARIEGLNQRLEREYPGYYSLLYNQQVLSPDVLKKKLKPSELLLEYFYAGNMLYRFELSSRGMDFRRIPLDAAFERELEIVKEFLSPDLQRNNLELSHDTFLEAAQRLCEVLIPASMDHSRLIIIPEGKLSYFPFDILVTGPVDDFSGLYSEVPFLIREHSIRYGYSATLMDRLEKGKRIRLEKLIAFAPGYGTDTVLMASTADFREFTIDRPSLQPLPGSIREANEISRITGGRAFTGETANEDLFKRLAGEGHILHLAAHAFLDDDDPLQSKLVFSEGKQVEDGFLNVYEIYNMDLEARMVVLSACNTGSGIMKRGEGIMSLARAFIYAGVPNIIMTLWTVSDRQSYKLMLAFYRHLIAGKSTENALRRAKLDYLEESSPSYQHPRYWAGYILVGNPDRLLLSRFYKFGIPVLFVSLLGLSMFLWRRRRISGKQG